MASKGYCTTPGFYINLEIKKSPRPRYANAVGDLTPEQSIKDSRCRGNVKVGIYQLQCQADVATIGKKSPIGAFSTVSWGDTVEPEGGKVTGRDGKKRTATPKKQMVSTATGEGAVEKPVLVRHLNICN